MAILLASHFPSAKPLIFGPTLLMVHSDGACVRSCKHCWSSTCPGDQHASEAVWVCMCKSSENTCVNGVKKKTHEEKENGHMAAMKLSNSSTDPAFAVLSDPVANCTCTRAFRMGQGQTLQNTNMKCISSALLIRMWRKVGSQNAQSSTQTTCLCCFCSQSINLLLLPLRCSI